MNRYLIECTIDATKLELFAAKRAEHYEFLIAHQDQIVFGGPARAEENGPPQTMVIAVEATSTEEARRFIADEPYNRSGGFSTVAIRPWSQVIPELTPGSLRSTLDAEHGTRGGS